MLAVVVLISVIDLEETAETLAGTDLRWVAVTLVMVPFQVLLRSARWRLLLPRRADGARPALRRVVPALLIGYFGNLVLPARLGEAVRGFLVARREQLGFARVLGSVLLERVIDLATLALVAVVAAVAAGAPGWMVQGIGVVALIGVVVAAVLVASGISRAAGLLERLAGTRLGRLRAGVAQLVRFGEGAGGGDGRGALTLAVLLSTVTWFFVAATYWLLGRSLGLGLDPADALLIAAIATLGTAIPSAPAHIGTFEVAAVVAATALGVPADAALALALLAHAITTLPFALAGAAAVTWTSVSLTGVADEVAAALPAERSPSQS